MNQQHVLLHLSLIDGIGPQTVQNIVARKPHNVLWHDLYAYSIFDLQHLGITEKIASKLHSGLADTRVLEQELRLIEDHQIEWASYIDESYPPFLREIYSPPPVLYWKGKFQFSDRMCAVVGSRETNSYGKKAIDAIVPDLVKHGFTIVSGGAIGADTYAHKAALQSGGKTLVIFGSGLLKPYPYQNRSLFEHVVEREGALMSIFSLKTTPHPAHFPARNRIISGLSRGVFVVQAAEKSGARITAQCALEQGRDVFALPGSIDDPLSAGCHALLQQGAKLVTHSYDILEEYGIEKHPHSAQKNTSIQTFDDISKPFYNEVHKKIVALCSTPQAVDDLAAALAMNVTNVQRELFELQIGGLIEQDFTGQWKTLV